MIISFSWNLVDILALRLKKKISKEIFLLKSKVQRMRKAWCWCWCFTKSKMQNCKLSNLFKFIPHMTRITISNNESTKAKKVFFIFVFGPISKKIIFRWIILLFSFKMDGLNLTDWKSKFQILSKEKYFCYCFVTFPYKKDNLKK